MKSSKVSRTQVYYYIGISPLGHGLVHMIQAQDTSAAESYCKLQNRKVICWVFICFNESEINIFTYPQGKGGVGEKSHDLLLEYKTRSFALHI